VVKGAFMRLMRNLLMAFVYAFAGIRFTLRQRNPRIQLFVGAAVIALAAWLRVSQIEWAMLILCIGFVIAAETINSAAEAMVNLLSPEIRPAAKIAKDTAAGAVLIAAVTAIVVGLLILGPPLWRRVVG
jgi:diacylglycerol kinase